MTENNPMTREEIIKYLRQFSRDIRVRVRLEYKDDDNPTEGGWMYVPITDISCSFLGEEPNRLDTIIIDVDLNHED